MAKKRSDFSNAGEALKFFLIKNQWTQEDLARILGISLKHTNELIKGKKAISIDIAKLLEKVFDMKSIDWVLMDIERQLLEKVDKKKNELVERSAYLYEFMPINELIKKGWLKNYNNKTELDKQIKSFWGIPKDKEIDLSFLKPKSLQLEYKKSEIYKKGFKEFNALIWHQKALNFSEKIKVPVFDKNKLNKLMSKMHEYTIKPNGVSAFLNELNLVGVKFCYLSHLSKTYLDGAAFWSGENPMITLTGRHNRVDNFWFTLAHEAHHVYAHLINDNNSESRIFIDDTALGKENDSTLKEKEANEMAEKLLLKNEIFEYFKDDFDYITEDKVNKFSELYKLHPSIVTGVLAFNNKISYSSHHRFKEPIRNQIPNKYIAE